MSEALVKTIKRHCIHIARLNFRLLSIQSIENRHRAAPARGGSLDLHRETGNAKARRRQSLEIVQLFDMAVTGVAPCLVSFPDQRGISGCGKLLCCMEKWRVPGPAVGAGHPDPVVQQKHGCLISHAAAAGDVIRLSELHTGCGVHHHDFHRTERMVDARQFGFNLLRADDMPIGKVAEVQFDTGLKTPVQRNFIYPHRGFTVILGGVKVPRCVEMSAIMCGQIDAFDRPPLAIGQLIGSQAGKKGQYSVKALLVVSILNFGFIAWRIGSYAVGDWHRQIYNPGHVTLPQLNIARGNGGAQDAAPPAEYRPTVTWA